MQASSSGKVQSAINVTPLVDVVLVLLIIFMVIAPQLQNGPPVDLPTTDQAPSKPDDGRQILVGLEHGGRIWLGDSPVPAADFAEQMERLAQTRAGWQVVIKADARLTYGEVKQAMLAVEAAGFTDVGLIAKRHDEQAG